MEGRGGEGMGGGDHRAVDRTPRVILPMLTPPILYLK